MRLPCCGCWSRVGCVCLMLGFLGPGASPKGCLGWVHRRRVQVMLHGVCPVNGEKA